MVMLFFFLVSEDGITKFEEDEYSRTIISEENLDTEPQKSMVLQFVLLDLFIIYLMIIMLFSGNTCNKSTHL